MNFIMLLSYTQFISVIIQLIWLFLSDRHNDKKLKAQLIEHC